MGSLGPPEFYLQGRVFFMWHTIRKSHNREHLKVIMEMLEEAHE